jgi:phosphatidylserine/phosphatidylglycerophosphate/cardiolipin synthase-like enzyme
LKLERKIEHRYVVSDPQFRAEMSVLPGPAVEPGNKVTALQNGNEIFPAMLQAIRSAQMSITFETFIYWSGGIGEKFSQALSEQAHASVPVTGIIDWVGSSKMEQSLLHTKLLVIDTEFVSVGSTNFDIRSIRLTDEASLNIYIGDFATQMTAVFENDLLAAESYSLGRWKSRPLREKFFEKILLPIRSQL